MYKVSDFVVDRLAQWGVRRVFGYPGDAINPVMTAIQRAGDLIEFVQARHEESCAFMACAHAKFTGQIGVCMTTAGPGAIHLLNGLYDAKMDNQPVLAIVGQQPRLALGTSFLQDVDLAALFKDVAHEYVNVAMTPEQVRHLIDRSIRIAYANRTVTCLILPHDVQNLEAQAQPKQEHGQSFSSTSYTPAVPAPTAAEIEQAASILNAGNKVAILVGAGALKAREEVLQVADILGAGVAKALLGKAVIEDSLPFVTGSIGMLGTKASWDLMTGCDTLLMVGSNFPYAEFLPKPDSVRGVQIDINPNNLSLRYPMEVGLAGDSAETLQKLIPLLKRKLNREWHQAVIESVTNSWSALDEQAKQEGTPVNPQSVFWRMSNYLPDRAMLTADSGTCTVWYARYLKIRPGMMASVSGGLASMGCSIPYAIAAKFAHPGRPVIAVSGDGAMQMLGNAELITVAKYWRQWLDPRCIVVVLKNNDLSFVTWEMRVAEGDPKFPASQDLPDFPYAEYAKSLGLGGFTISDASEIDCVLDKAFQLDRPVVVEVVCDPNIPPLPPHVDLKKGMALVSAILKGEPDGTKPLEGSLQQVWRSIFHPQT